MDVQQGAGFAGSQSVFRPAAQEAVHISHLWWGMFWVASAVYVVVMVAMVVIIARRRRADDAERSPARAHRVIAVAASVTIAILIAALASDIVTGRALANPPGTHMLEVRVTGHQWWWEVTYMDSLEPSREVHTANELHIPVGTPVRLTLVAKDVIHSFWAPNLHGKKDLVPGHKQQTVIIADTPGVYRAQCAEFCGVQHAKMAMDITVESPAQFTQWMQHQREPGVIPIDTLARRGRLVFESGTCSGCHTVAGSAALGQVAPDLTHIASRLAIGAGALPNTRGNLAGWVLNPHSMKPGVRMPANPMPANDLRALLAYLQELQ